MNGFLFWLLSPSSGGGRRSSDNGPNLVTAVVAVCVVVGLYAALFAALAALFGTVVFHVLIAVTLAVLAGGVVAAARGQRRLTTMAARQAAGQCVRCGYDLCGSATTRCPECGAPCVAHRRCHTPP